MKYQKTGIKDITGMKDISFGEKVMKKSFSCQKLESFK